MSLIEAVTAVFALKRLLNPFNVHPKPQQPHTAPPYMTPAPPSSTLPSTAPQYPPSTHYLTFSSDSQSPKETRWQRYKRRRICGIPFLLVIGLCALCILAAVIVGPVMGRLILDGVAREKEGNDQFNRGYHERTRIAGLGSMMRTVEVSVDTALVMGG